MRDADRFKLLGTYRTPRVRIGTRLTCEVRDCDVIVVGYSDGRIPWPIGRRPRLAAKGMILYGDLADAVRRESNQAVCYWFGVSAQTVSKWREGPRRRAIERRDASTPIGTHCRTVGRRGTGESSREDRRPGTTSEDRGQQDRQAAAGPCH
jgi:hypothetical protein